VWRQRRLADWRRVAFVKNQIALRIIVFAMLLGGNVVRLANARSAKIKESKVMSKK